MKTYIPLAIMAVLLTWAAANPEQAIDGARRVGHFVKEAPRMSVDVPRWRWFVDPFANREWAWQRYEEYQAMNREMLQRAQGGEDADALYAIGSWHLGTERYPFYGPKDPDVGRKMLRQAAALGHSMAAYRMWELEDRSNTTLRRISADWTGLYDNAAAVELAERARQSCNLRLMEEALADLTPYATKLPFTHPTGQEASFMRAELWRHDVIVSLQDLAQFRRSYIQRCA